jgi:hypothetical protein
MTRYTSATPPALRHFGCFGYRGDKGTPTYPPEIAAIGILSLYLRALLLSTVIQPGNLLGRRMLRSCAKAEGFRDSAERSVDGPDLRAMRGDARGNELSIDEADAFGKQAASLEHVSHVRRAYCW